MSYPILQLEVSMQDIYSLIYIPLYICFYITKRIFFLLVYPICYIFRRNVEVIRTGYSFSIDWEQNRNIRTKILEVAKNPVKLLIWFALDDAPYFSVGKEYYDRKCPSWLKFDFLKSYYWGAIRNNPVNLSRFISPGKSYKTNYFIDNNKIKLYFRKFKYFPKTLPFFKIQITNKIRFKIGWKSYGVFSFRLTIT